MSNKSITKRTLVSSFLAMFISVVMLIGTTFAWFTDTASTAVNSIHSGTLDVDLEMQDDSGEWVTADGKTLEFKKAAGAEGEPVLWEPGSTYVLPKLRVVNKGNLALKYNLVITGITGDAELLEAIDFNYEGLGPDAEGILLANETSPEITITGHMKETAGNEYQGMSIEGIAITVYATQASHESDSYGNDYDEDAVNEEYEAYKVQRRFEELVASGYKPASSAADVAAGGKIVLANDVTTGSDFASNEDTILDLNGNTLTAISDLEVHNGDLTMSNGTLLKTSSVGSIDIRPTENSADNVIKFENMNFINTAEMSHIGPSSNSTLDMIEVHLRTATDLYIEFSDCYFENAKVIFEGFNDSNGTIYATFKNCHFNNFGNQDAIHARTSNNVNVEIDLIDCTFDLETTSNIAAIGTNTFTSPGWGYVKVKGSGNVLNAKPAVPTDIIKVFTQSVKFVRLSSSKVDISELGPVTINKPEGFNASLY